MPRALGGAAVGTLAFGGVALGVFAAGGLSLRMFSFGGCAIATHLAVGNYAQGHVAVGNKAFGVRTIFVHVRNSVPKEEIRRLLAEEYPNLLKPVPGRSYCLGLESSRSSELSPRFSRCTCSMASAALFQLLSCVHSPVSV